jgi:hypothetical protein
MLELNEGVVAEIKKLTKPAFNIDDLLSTAGDLKYTREIKRLLAEQMENPSDEFVRFFASKVFDGSLTPTRRAYFMGITKRSFNLLVNERINDRLKSAMAGAADLSNGGVAPSASVTPQAEQPASEAAARETLTKTTEEELEGFFIVKALLRDMVEPARITHRDTQSYMGILLDANNRKPLARLHFNRGQKYIGIFDENRKEERTAIQSLNDIYQHAEKLRRVFAFYEREKETGGQVETAAEAS